MIKKFGREKKLQNNSYNYLNTKIDVGEKNHLNLFNMSLKNNEI